MAGRGKTLGSGSTKKAQSQSNKAGLQFLVGRIVRFLKAGVGIGWKRSRDNKKSIIVPRHIQLAAEKNELRDEKQKLKTEKEKLEQQMKAVSTPQPGFFHAPPTISPTFTAQSQAAGNKLVPIMSYPGVAMWQFMPPAAVDTSQDHVLHPPVA